MHASRAEFGTVPGEQVVQATLPEALTEPVGQDVGVEDARGHAEPAGQSVQELAVPVVLAK